MRSAKRLSVRPRPSSRSFPRYTHYVPRLRTQSHLLQAVTTVAVDSFVTGGVLESARTTVLTRVLSLLGSVLVTSSRLGPLRQPLVRAPVVTLQNPPSPPRVLSSSLPHLCP